MSIYLDEFETMYGISNNIEKLRNKILESAFKGNLSSFKETDTNLDFYLDELDVQRKNRIKKGKHYKKRNIENIKNKNQRQSRNWSFIRLSRVANIVTGSKNANYADENGKYPFFTCAKKPKRAKDYSFEGESILLPGNGANVGYVTYYNGKFEAYQRTYVVQPYGDINSKYLYYHFKYNWEKYNLNKQYGSATNYIKMKNLTNYIINITSPEEQKRIVDKIEKLMKEVDKLETKLEEKEEVSQNLSESIVETIKSSQNAEELKENLRFIIDNFDVIFKTSESMDEMRNIILQLAVEGKLVPQDESDEPASELIDRIDKTKKDKKPFEIPEKWEWISLKKVGKVQTGTTPKTSNSNYYDGNIPFIKPGDIGKEGINYKNESLTREGLKVGRKIKKHSILMVCIGGSMGKTYYTDRLISCNQQINSITPNKNINYWYINYCLSSKYFYGRVWEKATGSATPIINKTKWSNILIPLPPLEEQKRIVKKVNSIMSIIDKLEKELSKKEDLVVKLGSI